MEELRCSSRSRSWMENSGVTYLPRSPGSSMKENLKPVSRASSLVENVVLQSRSNSIPRCPVAGHPKVVKVIPTSKSVIVPATPTDPHWLHLTNLDRVVNPTFISLISFYEDVLTEGTGPRSFRAVTAALKESLAKVLVDFFPLAGRLAVRADQEAGLIDLHCNDAGAIFVEAAVNVELAELGGPQPMPMLSGMDVLRSGPGRQYLPDQVTPMPLLVIQITQFTCGSIAVAANWHHTVADAFSGCHFMRSWSELSTGQEISLRPCHDRWLLKPRNPPAPGSMMNGYSHRSSSETVEQHLASRPLRCRDQDAHAAVVQPFVLSKNKAQKLKESLNGSIEQGQFTAAESVSAELWKLMTRARSDDEGNCDRVSRFFMFVDGRKRLGLPPGYFGNVVCTACAVSTTRDLLASPLSYAANLIRKATRAVNNDHLRALIDWLEVQRAASKSPSVNCKSDHVLSTGDDVAVTFWTFFPLYEINFGWGKPILSVRNAPPRQFIDGVSIMPSPAGRGNMVALLNLHVDRMQRLERDPEFRDASFEPLDFSHRLIQKPVSCR